MTLSWQIPIGTLLLILGNVVACVSAYWGIQLALAKQTADLALNISTVRSEMQRDGMTLRDSIMKVVSAVEVAVADLTHRVGTLETGRDEWTKTLRERTHELSNQVNVLNLKVDRLERPKLDLRNGDTH